VSYWDYMSMIIIIIIIINTSIMKSNGSLQAGIRSQECQGGGRVAIKQYTYKYATKIFEIN